MDQSTIADRRQLRRKLTFWRVVAVLVAAIAVFAAIAANWPQTATQEHIARVAITGIIKDDRELVERLDRIAKNDRARALVVSITSPGGLRSHLPSMPSVSSTIASANPAIFWRWNAG